MESVGRGGSRGIWEREGEESEVERELWREGGREGSDGMRQIRAWGKGRKRESRGRGGRGGVGRKKEGVAGGREFTDQGDEGAEKT